MPYSPNAMTCLRFKPLKQGGVTQIEVLVGMMLTGILALGLSGLWAVVDEQFFHLQLRQKAIFLLNAETERISALYRYSNFANAAGVHADSGNTEGRWIYRGDPTNVFALVRTETRDIDVTTDSFDEGEILYMGYAGQPLSPSHVNVIWLDKAHSITALLEWQLSKTDSLGGNTLTSNCYNDSCFGLEVRLTYPYRLEAGTGPAEETMGKVETVRIRTLVGRRG